MTNRIILVLFLLNLVQLGYAQKKVKPSLAQGTFSRQIAYGMLNSSIMGGTTLLFGSALSFEAANSKTLVFKHVLILVGSSALLFKVMFAVLPTY